MKPTIESTDFGCITIDGNEIEHDVVIRLNGEIVKRKKKSRKDKYASAHMLSLEEAKHIYDEDANLLIIGSGQYGAMHISHEAIAFFRKKGCEIKLLPTPEAVTAWNNEENTAIAMFHITC